MMDSLKLNVAQSQYKTLRVLLVEDSENDAILIIRNLTKAGYQVDWVRVETADEMKECLRQGHWDIILSDYTLPTFNGLLALNTLKESGLDIPFILISGAIGEETAVAAMKAGAGDYLLKDNLARLAPAVERELNDAKSRTLRRQAEEARKQLEIELKQAKEFAELANKRKSKVLAFVAHEFKNPLKAIETFAELLEKSKAIQTVDSDVPEVMMYIQGILTASRHLKGLMEDILDIAPIEAGKIVLDRQKVDITLLLDEIHIILEETAKRKKINIRYERAEQIRWIDADPKRIRQILINLLSNALKYTHEGDTVLVNIQIGSQGQFVIEIEDHGPGIPEKELQNLFADYYRVKNMLSKQNEGLGLGLALVKQLVELHEGEIQVESYLQKGTIFRIHFPASMLINSDASARYSLLEV